MNPIPLFKVFMSEDVIKPITDVLMSGFITQGAKVEEFESQLSKFIGNKNILTLNSATAGLTLALRLLKNADVESGWPGFDEDNDLVLSPALTCFATNASILANHCRIGWLDVDPHTANISLTDLERKLNKSTKVIYIVHWGGYPVDLNHLKRLQLEHETKYGYQFRIIEDCAHAFGATYRGQMLGNHGNICVFSFQAIKHLTTGDGGMIILPTQQLYDRAKLLRWYGIDRDKRNYKRTDFRMENDIAEYGYKFHMNDINATLGIYNLPHMPLLLQKNRHNYAYLYAQIKQRCPHIDLMDNDSDRESACWLFTICVDNKPELILKFKESAVATSQVHNRNDINTCVKEFMTELPNLDSFEKRMLCIPCGWWLSQADLDYIINSLH